DDQDQPAEADRAGNGLAVSERIEERAEGLNTASLNASRFAVTAALTLVVAGWVAPLWGNQDDRPRLSKSGPAPGFTLTNQEGKPLSLRQLRGKVVITTFIFTGCGSTCPLLTSKLVAIQRRLGADSGAKVYFA